MEYGGREILQRGGEDHSLKAVRGLSDSALGSGREGPAGRGVSFVPLAIVDHSICLEEGAGGVERAKFVEVRETGVCNGKRWIRENIQGLNIWGLRWRQLDAERTCYLVKGCYPRRENGGWGAYVGKLGRRAVSCRQWGSGEVGTLPPLSPPGSWVPRVG